MARLTISIASQGEVVTVSEMRRRLARVLSKLTGQSEITFSFSANLENYKPAPPMNRRPCLGRDPMPYCESDERFVD